MLFRVLAAFFFFTPVQALMRSKDKGEVKGERKKEGGGGRIE